MDAVYWEFATRGNGDSISMEYAEAGEGDALGQEYESTISVWGYINLWGGRRGEDECLSADTERAS